MTMTKGKIFNLTLMISILFLLTACSTSSTTETQETSSSDKQLTFLFNYASQTLDPHQDYTPLRAGVAETMVKLGEDLTIQPWIAEKWASEDRQHWTFTIRDGLTFHNGKKVDADAVKQSLERAMEQNPGVKQVLQIRSMEANGQILNVETEKIFPQFPSELVHPNTAIIDVTEPNVDKNPVGTGPFQVDSFTAGTALQLKRYDGYWDGVAKLDRATFAFNEDENARLSALSAGDVDIAYRPPLESIDKIKQNSELHLDSVVSVRTNELIFNMGHDDFQNVYVRKAFDALVNREELKTDIMGGQATIAEGPFLPEFPFNPSYEKKATGTEEALKLFQQAGYQVTNGKVTKDGQPITWKLVTYASRAEFPIFAQVLQSKAKELGITITIELVENYEDYLLTDDSWDLGTYSPLISPRGDASYFLNVAFLPDGTLNYGKVNDEKLTGLIEQLDQTVDTDVRNELIKKTLKRIDEQTYYSYLVHPNTVVVYKDRVENWVTSKSEYYMLTNQLDVKDE